MSAPIENVLRLLKYDGSKTSGERQCICPAHKDEQASLSITEGKDGKVLMHCFAGCKTESIVEAMGLKMADIMPPVEKQAKKKSVIAATYDYRDERGALVYQAVRYDPKRFVQRRPDGHGGWIWDMKGVQRVPYRLPSLLGWSTDEWVFIPEGEKDCDNLDMQGLLATCNVGGAGKWEPQLNKWLAGRKVCALPDNDDPGREHAHKIAGQLLGIAAEVKVLELPGLAIKGDVSDWLKAGGTADQLLALVEASPSYIAPPPTPTATHTNGNGNGADDKEPTPKPPTFTEYSDLASAEYAHRLYGKELVFTASYGWMRNVGTHLTTDQAEAHAQRRVNEALRQQASMALATGNTELLKRSIPDARNTRSALYQFKSLATISTGDLDGEPHLLNTLSGVIDERTGDLVTGEMSNRFTYCVQTEYHRGAHILTAPLFTTKLAEWFNQDLTTIGFVERVLGYGITGETKEEIFVWLQGQRRSGKGTILNTVQELLGAPLAMSLAMKSLTNEGDDPQHFALAPLRPARFVVASESKQHQRLDSGLLKWITGRDTIQVANKGKDPFQMKPQFKLFAMSNYLPNIDAGDDAMHGRVKIIKMPNSYYGTEDKDLKAALLSKEQRELLLSMLVAQAGFYYKMGLVVPKDVEARAEEVRRASNPTYGWMGEAIFAKPGNSELLNDWYQSYCAWCEDWGYKPTQKGWFARTLNEAGYPTRSERPRDDSGKKQSITYVMDGQLEL
jgi:putative DNA primase/helicase